MLQFDEKDNKRNSVLNYSLTEPGVHQFLVSLNSIENDTFDHL